MAETFGFDEAEAGELFLELGLGGRGQVDVARHHSAAGIIFRRCAADEDGAGEAAGDHRLAETRKEAEGVEELWSVWSFGHAPLPPPLCARLLPLPLRGEGIVIPPPRPRVC